VAGKTKVILNPEKQNHKEISYIAHCEPYFLNKPVLFVFFSN